MPIPKRMRSTRSSRGVSDANKACLSYDIEPMTLDYRQCMDSETGRITVSRYEAR